MVVQHASLVEKALQAIRIDEEPGVIGWGLLCFSLYFNLPGQKYVVDEPAYLHFSIQERRVIGVMDHLGYAFEAETSVFKKRLISH